MQREEFERLVIRAIDGLPEEFKRRLDNVDLIVEEWPSRRHLREQGLGSPYQLLGLYEGIPLTERHGYNLVLPDKITVFQHPIEAICGNAEEIVEEVKKTVIHEIAHHFGIDDERLDELDT